jgi:alkanesulfonate monooxygenase SsuD/methylene tetrahydromethanopterin reductase-like flavin-dependent oxidoreductase (luciferase family)
VEFGACLPYMKRGYDRRTTLDWCRGVESGPFRSLSCGERITSYAQEMRVLISAAAALTSRVRIVPSLYVLPMHDPVWAAKELATLDVLSDGRVTAVVGIGGRPDDYRAVGASFERRYARLDQGVARMRAIWAGEPPFPGADPVGPAPVQKGGPPVLAGSMGPKSTARTVRWADGVYGFSVNADPAVFASAHRTVSEAWQAAGRSGRPYQATGFWYSLADGAEAKLREYAHEYLKIAGDAAARAVAATMTAFTPDAVNRAIDAIEAQGYDECFLVAATAERSEFERAAELIAKR